MKKFIFSFLVLYTCNLCLSQSAVKWDFNGVTIKEDQDFSTKPNTCYGILWITHDEINPHIDSFREEIVNYDGLEARYINKTEGNLLVLAQFTNLKGDKMAIIVVTPLGSDSKIEILQPGEKLTKKYDGQKLEVQVKHIDPVDNNELTFDFIKSLRDWIGSQIKDGKLIQQKKFSSTCMCVRG